MSRVLHIEDAYFKIPDKCNDDFACAITLLGIYLQRNNLTLDGMNEIYDNTERIADFLDDDEQVCLLSSRIE